MNGVELEDGSVVNLDAGLIMGSRYNFDYLQNLDAE